jgi:RNA polymerase sigma-70 factor, ECF subfamily
MTSRHENELTSEEVFTNNKNGPSNTTPVHPSTTARAGVSRAREDEFLASIEGFREYLTVLAGRKLGQNLAAKVAPSDLVQETLCVAVQKARMFRAEGDTPARLRGWLERILDHKLANARYRYLGTGKRRLDREVPAADLADSATSPSRVVHGQECRDALREALERLPDHYRRVMLWRYWERLDYDAIGRKLGISTEAARKIGGRALIELRTLVGPAHDPS